MALEGKIFDFGVADILQLISQQQKTGMLLVKHDQESIEVLFWNGMIVSAHPVAKTDKDLLGARLVRSGLVSEGQLKQALSIQQKSQQHIGEILIEMNIISRERLDRIIQNQIYDTFAELFQWKDGSYAFHPSSVTFNEKLFTPLGLEHIILDVLRMVDEWPLMLKSIDSLDAVYKRTEQFATALSTEDAEATMMQDQKLIFSLLNKDLTVAELADISLLGKFATVQAVRALLDRELIEQIAIEEPVEDTTRTYQQILNSRFFVMAWYAMLAMIVLCLFYVSPPDLISSFRQNSPVALITVLADTLEHNKLIKIRNALQVYIWEQGTYPGSLEALVTSGLLQKEEIHNHLGNSFIYSTHQKRYTLR